jgi:murein DD-endopeptidase MepM/ murein hydrolase activator NlpD
MKLTQLSLLTKLFRGPRRPVLAALGALMLGTGVVAFGVSPNTPDAAQSPVRQVKYLFSPSIGVPDLVPSTTEFLLHQSQLTRRGDTLQALLKRLGVEDQEAQTFLASDATSRLMFAGSPGKLASVSRTAEGRLEKLSVRWVDAIERRVSRLVVDRQAGGFNARLEQPVPRRFVQFGSLTVRSSFYAATDEAGIPDEIAGQTVEAFSGDLDFRRDLQKGARVGLVYEAFELDGETLFTGQLLGAEIKSGGDTHQAMWFQTPGKAGEFVSLDGSSQQRAYLASPLVFSRVTSSYGPRIHPVYGGQKAHKGTDYGAPAGTPIRTVADGVVTFSGRKGGYGNYVVIKHPDKNATAYAHLGRIAVRLGQRVKQGETIGTVGSTGTATGPNLHFEYLVRGVRTNPSRITSNSSTSTNALANVPEFKDEAKAIREQLALANSVVLASAQ